MQNPEPFAVIGGDRRMDHLAAYLSREHPVIRWRADQSRAALEETIMTGKHLLFPMPFTRDGVHIAETESSGFTLEDLLSMLNDDHLTLFGGQLPSALVCRCEPSGIHTHDWMEMEDVAMPNAALTAEGAIAEAILHARRSLGTSRCLILGWGRCAQALARRLRYLVKDITIAARNPFQRLNAQSEGFTVLPLSDIYDTLSEYDLLLNTIPAMILPGKYASQLSGECVLLDLASGPLSAHIETAHFQGNALSCPGLPGKYFSKDAGEILARAALSRIPIS